MEYTLGEIARRIGATMENGQQQTITGVAELEAAGAHQLAFAESNRYRGRVERGCAGGVIVAEDFPALPGKNLLRAGNPRIAFMLAAELFVETQPSQGIHPAAWVDEGAQIGADCSIGPCAVICQGAHVGDHACIQPGAYVGPGVTIGNDCRIEANATLLEGVVLGDRVIIHAGCTIGGDGFGYLWMEDHQHKFPQLGGVEIEDDVEIGCNSCVDRATLGVTRIGRGSKLDNLVQIAHNNLVGRHVVMAGQAGTAGTVTIGDRCMIGGQSAISDHVRLGDQVIVGGASGVTKEIPAGEMVMGIPARPMRKVQREAASLSKLPDLLKAFRQQTRELEALRQRVAELEERSATG